MVWRKGNGGDERMQESREPEHLWSFLLLGKDLEGFLGVADPENCETLFGIGAGRQIGVLDVDLGLGQLAGDLAKGTRFIEVFGQQNVVFHHKNAPLFQEKKRLVRVTHHHAHHRVVGCVRNRHPEDVDPLLCKNFAHFRKGAGFIGQKDGELLGDLHKLNRLNYPPKLDCFAPSGNYPKQGTSDSSPQPVAYRGAVSLTSLPTLLSSQE